MIKIVLFRPRGMCNSTGLVNMASMSSLGHCIGIHCCYDGILVRASLPKYYKETHEGPSEMGLVRDSESLKQSFELVK